MKTKEILSLEKENDCCIHLLKEGIFWRAYNGSAFLTTKYIRDFKVTKKYIKIVDETVLFIGFPHTILSKIIKKAAGDFSVKSQSDDRVILELRDSNKKIIQKDYEIWDENISSKPDKKEYSCKSILKNIQSFPILEKTPMESQLFLSQLQQQVNGII